jgi:hypothetical protein
MISELTAERNEKAEEAQSDCHRIADLADI